MSISSAKLRFLMVCACMVLIGVGPNPLWAHPKNWRDKDRFQSLTVRVVEMGHMNWGTIAIPASGTEYVEINPLNQSTHGTGRVLFGTPSRGVYKIVGSGENCAAITIDVGGVSTASPHLRIDHFTGVYSSIPIRNFPSPTLPGPAASPAGTLLYLGARETVSSSMRAKSLAPSFDIDVVVN